MVAGNQGSETHLWLIRPTSDDILESTTLPAVSRGVRTQVGDRLYFTSESGLSGVRTRDLTKLANVDLGGAVSAVAPTPSGDRLYVAIRGRNQLSVVDRYSETVAATVQLPGPAEDLRMDPLGQNLLAKPASDGDSAWVIGISTNKVKGSIRAAWRSDLPAFVSPGSIAAARGADVVMVSASDLRDGTSVSGGASDFWYFFAWNGFRPRSADLDQPVTFDTPVSYPSGDSTGIGRDTSLSPTVRDASPSMVEPSITPARPTGYMVSFAAVLSEQKASEVAAGISVNGVRPKVVSAASGSTTVYRVVLGPYSTREEADRVGRDSKSQYWVYEESR